MFLKFLIGFGAALVILWWVRKSLGWKQPPKNDSAAANEKPNRTWYGKKKAVLLPCAHCGLHVPQTEAIVQQGKAYCSLAHLQAASVG